MELEALRCPRNNSESEDPLLENQRKKLKEFCKLYNGFKITITIIVILLLMAFSIIFVDFPLVFMHSIKLQQKVLFMPSDGLPEEFINVQKYALGARNFFITVNETANITLGVWHLLPEELIKTSLKNKNFNYAKALAQQNHPVLLHFHENYGNRIYNTNIYVKLRKFFHVIAFDYRSYGDSSKAELTEEGIVQDSISIYKWLLSHTARDNIYVWGHSMGAALATHTIAKLFDENITPMGLILEAPFTNLREQVEHSNLAKGFSWLPWFGVTILDGFGRNGFYFKTTENILKVDCPILILHAEDDRLVPAVLGKKLFQIALKERNPGTQGNVTFHLISAKGNYGHWGVTNAPELRGYIRDHIDNCKMYKNQRERSTSIC